MKPMDIAQSEIRKLAKTLNYPALASIPVQIYVNHVAPAYTSQHGIFIREDIVLQHPTDIAVYLLHEIFHHVVRDEEITSHYSPNVANYAEDYIINRHLKHRFGLDVKKVAVKGIYSDRIGKMSLKMACDEVVRKVGNPPNMGCWCFGISHPTIIQLAFHIRQRYGINNVPSNLFVMDNVDAQNFDRTLPGLRTMIRTPQLPINLYELMRGVWLSSLNDRMTLDNVKVGPLTLTQAIGYTWKNEISVNIDDADLATAVCINTLAHSLEYITTHVYQLIEKIYNKKSKLRFIQKRIKDKWKIGKTSRKLEKQENKVSREIMLLAARRDEAIRISKSNFLVGLQQKHPIHIRNNTVVHVSNLRSSLQKTTSDPYVLSRTPLHKWIVWLNRISNKKFEALKDLREDFKLNLGSLADTGEEQQPKKGKKGKEGKEGEGSQGNNKSEDGEEQNEGQTGESENQEAGTGAGSRQEVTNALATLNQREIKSLSSILSYMAEFESALSSRKSKKIDELSLDPTTVPYIGSDITMVDPSELALLHDPITKLEFLARYAQGGLSIQIPVQSKRSAVVIAIDCSGSMRHTPYEIGCGFALAMIKILHKEGRGSALMIFHDGIHYQVTINERKAIPLADLIVALLTAESGGTDFSQILYEAFQIKKAEKWESMSQIVITDGYGNVNTDVTNYVRREKRPSDNLTLALIGGASRSGFNDLEDDVFQLSKRDMQLKLERIGKSVL